MSRTASSASSRLRATGGEPVGLDHDRDRAGVEIGEGGRDGVEERGGCGRDAIFQQELFGENLRRLETGAIGFRSIGGNADGGEPVNETERQGNLGPDDDKGHLLALGEGDQAVDVVGGDGKA
jgi:hypothetical protein